MSIVIGAAQVPLLWCGVMIIVVVAYYRVQQLGLLASLAIMAVMIAGCMVGAIRYAQHMPPQLHHVEFDTPHQITGIIARPPITTGTTQKLYLLPDDTTESAGKHPPGKVYIKTGRYPSYHYGDRVTVHCTLLQPKPFDTFAFDKYLARHEVFTICQRARLQRLESGQGNPVFHGLYAIRNWFRSRIRQLWPEPVASLMLGVILGIQDDIPDDIVEQFRVTGTIHVLVVSGMHVVIIAQLLTKALRGALSARWRFIVIGGVLFGFCVITGLQASVVRAAIMGMVPLLAELVYRRPTMHISLPVIAAVMALDNPYVVLHDMGFQLSFLATIGLVYFQPLCDRACWWVPSQFTLRETVSTTVAATIPTTPLIISTFGTFSVVSLVANIVVVPISNIMLFGGTAAIALQQALPMLPNLAQYVAYVLNTIVWWMLNIITYLSDLPFALLENLQAPPSVILTSYLIIIAYCLLTIINSQPWTI